MTIYINIPGQSTKLQVFDYSTIKLINNRTLKINNDIYKIIFYSIPSDCFLSSQDYYKNWNKCCGDKRTKRYKNLDTKCKTLDKKLEYISYISLVKKGCFLRLVK